VPSDLPQNLTHERRVLHRLHTDRECRTNPLAGVLGIRLRARVDPAQYRPSIDCVANAGTVINPNGRVDDISWVGAPTPQFNHRLSQRPGIH
jgi:hypothetical protein